MSLVMQGNWTISVKAKNASFPQRFIIAGAASGNGVYNGQTGAAPVVVNGARWTISIEANGGSGFTPSAMRYKTPQAVGASVQVDIESDDNGGASGGSGDQDFDDLVLTCTMAASATDFVVHGHASAYSGFCLFNPCWRRHLVIDSLDQFRAALKNSALRAAIEQLYPELVRPHGPGNPPDPGPLAGLATFTPLMLPTPRAPGLPAPVRLISQNNTAALTKVQAAEAAPATTRQLVFGSTASTALLDSALTTQLGRLLDGFQRVPLRCTTTPLARYALRFQEYDRTADELSGRAYTSTGHRELLGGTVTDAFGNYVFRFTRSISDIVDEALNDVAVAEDATVQALPDVIAQVLGAGSVPAAETACHFNVGPLHRIDICVPAGSVVLPTGCVDGHILTFIGKISLTSALNSIDGSGRITAASTAGNAPTIQCGVWWGDLDFWGCFGAKPNDSNRVTSYTLRIRPQGSGNGAWQYHGKDEFREAAGGLSRKVGPFFDQALAVPFDLTALKVNAPRYLNTEGDDNIVQPGAFLKASVPTAGMAPGSYELRIDGYNSAGDVVGGEQITLMIDNRVPDVRISDITLAGVPVNISGSGCTLQTLGGAGLSGDLTVRFKVDHGSGAILNYAVGVSRCNEGAGFPVSHAGGGDPSFSWVHDASVDCQTPPNFRTGTAEDADSDGSGYVTTVLSPVSPWLAADEPFTILRVSVSFNWRATNGYGNATGTTRGPLVWGIQQ